LLRSSWARLTLSKLLESWSQLETAYRIPKRLKDSEDGPRTADFLTSADLFGSSGELRPLKKRKEIDDVPVLDIKPVGFANVVREPREPSSTPIVVQEEPKEPLIKRPSKAQTASIIAAALAAQQAESAAAALRAEEERKAAQAKAERRRQRKEREKNRPKKDKAASREANREKRLLKLVGAVVVNALSKYKAKLPAETFKKHAKEVRFPSIDSFPRAYPTLPLSLPISSRRKKRKARVTRITNLNLCPRRKLLRSRSSPRSTFTKLSIGSKRGNGPADLGLGLLNHLLHHSPRPHPHLRQLGRQDPMPQKTKRSPQ